MLTDGRPARWPSAGLAADDASRILLRYPSKRGEVSVSALITILRLLEAGVPAHPGLGDTARAARAVL